MANVTTLTNENGDKVLNVNLEDINPIEHNELSKKNEDKLTDFNEEKNEKKHRDFFQRNKREKFLIFLHKEFKTDLIYLLIKYLKLF